MRELDAVHRERVFAAQQPDIRRAAKDAGVSIEEGDWEEKWIDDDTPEAADRVKR